MSLLELFLFSNRIQVLSRPENRFLKNFRAEKSRKSRRTGQRLNLYAGRVRELQDRRLFLGGIIV
jgi:hypothetical protein